MPNPPVSGVPTIDKPAAPGQSDPRGDTGDPWNYLLSRSHDSINQKLAKKKIKMRAIKTRSSICPHLWYF
jgi:hypothetical protein